MQDKSVLAIWSDIAREHEIDYLHWLTREHTSERVSTQGFLSVRVFRSMRSDVCRYFICYDLEEPGIVASPAYLAKLNNPTVWSQRIMPLLGNFRRGGGRVLTTAGVGQGGILAPVIFCVDRPQNPSAIVESLAGNDAISAVRYLEVDRDKTSVQTREKSMRKNDLSFAALLLIEGVNERGVRGALNQVATLSSNLSQEALDEPVYQHVFSLRKDMLTAA